MKNYLLIGIALVILVFTQNSCKKEPEAYINVTDFEIIQRSDTVPTTIRLSYSVEVQNDCDECLTEFYGADSLRFDFYNENNPNSIDSLKFEGAEGTGGLIFDACANEEALVKKCLFDLQYLNAGEYRINITIGGKTETKSVILSDAQ